MSVVTMGACKLRLQPHCMSCMTSLSGLFSLGLTHSFSSFQCLRARKKTSQYSSVDTERYSSLVKAVVSNRISAQTPKSIEDEDTLLFGSIIRSKPQATEVPKIVSPLLNQAKNNLQPMHEEGPVVRITYKRDSNQPQIPSVTKMLQKTMSAQQLFYLERWKRRKIAELGEEGFEEYSLNLFKQGKLFHAAIECILTQENLVEDKDRPEEIDGYLKSIGHVLDDVTRVRAIESVVHHQPLNYLGIVDCVAMYKGSLCVIDWKTSEKPKPLLDNTFDNPLQVAAYIGALNFDNNYSFQVENGLIVVAYKDGSPAHAHFINTERVKRYWEKWLLRLQQYLEKDAEAVHT